jgi:hypothetical protein
MFCAERTIASSDLQLADRDWRKVAVFYVATVATAFDFMHDFHVISQIDLSTLQA